MCYFQLISLLFSLVLPLSLIYHTAPVSLALFSPIFSHAVMDLYPHLSCLYTRSQDKDAGLNGDHGVVASYGLTKLCFWFGGFVHGSVGRYDVNEDGFDLMQLCESRMGDSESYGGGGECCMDCIC